MHLGAPSDFQNLLDSHSQGAGTKPQVITPVLQGPQTQQQNKQENDIANRKRKLHFQQKDLKIFFVHNNSLYFAFPVVFNNSILREKFHLAK